MEIRRSGLAGSGRVDPVPRARPPGRGALDPHVASGRTVDSTTDDADARPDLVRVGDLAAAAGLTVGALHHYEEIRILRPSARSAAGYRLHGTDAVERVYRINRMRRLELSLDQITKVLDDPASSLAGALRDHLASVDTEFARLTSLRNAMAAALHDVDHATDPTIDLLEVLNAMELLDRPLRQRISILVYRDIAAVHRCLVDVFGLTPRESTVAPDGTVVHGEVDQPDGSREYSACDREGTLCRS